MDKILQKIGAFLGSKFNRIYTLFNDKYNELDKNKVDKEEGKELMPSPEGTSDTVFLSETGWREVNTDKIRTHVITIYVPFSNEWDYMGSQEIILDGKDYNREEAESFIYDYFTYNNANAVIRNTNSGISQEGYYIVWKVSGAFSDEKQSLKLFLDIPKNNSILLDPDNENSEFTRYTISLYFTSEGKSYSLDSIGVTPNGTDSFIPKEYLDDKLHNLSSSYLPLIAGPNNPLEGDLYFQNPNGVKLAFKDSNTSYDILKVENIEGGKRVILGFEENLSPDIATGPIFTTVKSQDGKVCTAGLVYESSYGFLLEYDESVGPRVSIGTPSDVDIYHFTDAQNAYIIYDSRNLSINKSFNTDIQVSQNSGTHKHILTYTKYNPTTSTSETVNIDLLPVTDTADGLMTPSYKTVLDKLIPTTGESMSIYGTPSSTWQLTLGTGPKLKNSGGIFELRDNSDNAYTDLILNNITIKGNVTQEGSSFITKAETVEVSDNILLLNRGEVGSGVTKGISGIQVDRGALADYQFIFDESDDRFKVGVEGDLWPVMLRNNESDLSDKFFLSWDASLKRAVTTNIVPETGLLFSGGVSNHPEYDITVAATGSGSIGFGALQANTPWSCTIGYNLNTRDVPSADILDFATSLNAYRYDKPSVLNMIYFDTYLSPNSIEPYGASSISLTTGSGDDLIHTKGGQNYIIYDSSNLDVEGLIQNYTLSGNIIGTPKATRIKGITIPSGSDFINNFRELIWGTNDATTWIVPFRSNSANTGLGGAYAANLGWSLGDTHAYISISYRNDLRSVIIGGGNEGKINWFEQVAFKSDINNLSSVYYPYSGRGHMSILSDGRPLLANNQGVLFNTTSGSVEGIYVNSNNHLIVGGSSTGNLPVDIFNDLNITRIVDRSTNFSLLTFQNGGTEDSQYTHIGAEHGTTRIRSGLFNLVHDRGGTLYTVLDTFNVSSDLYEHNLNSLGKFPRLSAQTLNDNATPDREYPIQEAGSLINIPGVYNGSSQIYGTYDSNRWFVRGGANVSNDPTTHTSWKELATTNHLSNYLPLTGGTLTGSLNIGDSSQNVYNYIRIRRNNYTFETTVSEGSGILSLDSSNSGVTPTMLKISPGGHAYINDEELAKVSQIPSMSGYLPLSGGVLSGSDGIVLRINSPSSAPAVDIIFSIGNSIKSSVGFESGTLGAFLSDDVSDKVFCLKHGPEIRTNSGTLIGKIPYKSDLDKYLPLSGGTLTRTTSGPTLSIRNTSTNKEAFIDFYKGETRCGYIGAAASRTEDMYLYAYDSRNIIVGSLGLVRFDTGASNLIHSRNGTEYTILDTYNVRSLTIQFNGSTNAIYNPSVSRTVNITPAAIGAAASSHTHTKSQITDFPSSMPASDVYAWAKASSKPSYSYSEVGAAAASHTHTTIQGTYTGSGGSQPPSYVTAGTLRANMMYHNMSGSPYCDWLMMDTYTGSDVPYVTMIGVTKTATPRAFIASGPKGNASTSSWVRKELATLDAIPTTMAWGSITGVPTTATRWPSWSEVTSKPSFATVATSGSYNDLSNKPSIPSAETAATIMSKINSQSEITFSKHVVCSAGAGTSSTSDIRFKNNITSLAPVLSHVLGSPGFFYTWKDEDEVLVGTSAQYWEGRITGLVREINDKSKTKTFSYERYTVILQEALKEEHMLREAEKEEYRKEICSLREELEDLKKLIQKLL